LKSRGDKVLFISHEASRSGAPIVLLHLLRWIKNNTTLRFDILLLRDGPLKSEFEGLGKTILLNEIARPHAYSSRIKKHVFKITEDQIHRKIAKHFARTSYRLVYGNTIASLPWLKIFKHDHGFKTICCIHELAFSLNYFFPQSYLAENLLITDSVIAVSGAVKENLVDNYGVPEEKVKLHYEFIDTCYTADGDQCTLREELGINGNEFIIGCGGTPEWRKGTDLIIPVAQGLLKNHPGLKFKIVWLGADTGEPYVKQLLFDADKCGISSYFRFVKSQPAPLTYLNIFDVFVLLSREDSFPLIALEAALLKKPIIAFAQSGGVPELIGRGAGLLAPYLDTACVADHIYKLSSDKKLMTTLGNKGSELVTGLYSTNTVAPEIYKHIVAVMRHNQ
jgi:glycosyltransferase involved in cell wall biosynthesis